MGEIVLEIGRGGEGMGWQLENREGWSRLGVWDSGRTPRFAK